MTPPSHTARPSSYRLLLIFLGCIEAVFPPFALLVLYRLVTLPKEVSLNLTILYLGFGFFSLSLGVALMQLSIGIFHLECLLGRTSSRILIILGVVFTVLTLPALLFFIINPIYSLTATF